MKLIKINTEHYIVVDDSEIKERDWLYNNDREPSILQCIGKGSIRGWKKITHSTEPLNNNPHYAEYKMLSLQEVKELIGDVDVVKKAEEIYLKYDNNQYLYGDSLDMQLSYKAGVVDGYNHALEDNKEKKYTKDDLKKAICIAKDSMGVDNDGETCYSHLSTEQIIQYLQPKTEWEVEIVDGKLKLK